MGERSKHLYSKAVRKRGGPKRGARKTSIDGRIMIDKRPKSVENRKEFGHFEGDFIESGKDFKTLTRAKVEDVHRLLVDGLGVPLGLRRHAVRITGTNYRPLDNEHQIREAVEKAIVAINAQEEPIARAFMAVTLISYVQPFADGNKRTARILGDAILVSHDCCPLSYRSVDESAYKKAMILFYEEQSFAAFKQLFIEQYLFAVRTYFTSDVATHQKR